MSVRHLGISFGQARRRINGSVQESDGKRDFSGVAFPAKTATVAVVAVGNVETRVWCGFPSSVGRATTLRKDSAVGPTERHFHSEPGNSAHFVQMSSSDDAEDENPCFQKAA